MPNQPVATYQMALRSGQANMPLLPGLPQRFAPLWERGCTMGTGTGNAAAALTKRGTCGPPQEPSPSAHRPASPHRAPSPSSRPGRPRPGTTNPQRHPPC